MSQMYDFPFFEHSGLFKISILTYIFLFEDLEECLNEGFTPYSVVHQYLMLFYIQSGVNCWAKEVSGLSEFIIITTITIE